MMDITKAAIIVAIALLGGALLLGGVYRIAGTGLNEFAAAFVLNRFTGTVAICTAQRCTPIPWQAQSAPSQ